MPSLLLDWLSIYCGNYQINCHRFTRPL